MYSVSKSSVKKKGFTFKQFFVAHDRCGMKVSTDGVLLGAWASLPANGRVLDIGTGSGLLTLMLAQRLDSLVKPFQIDAVEIDPSGAGQARENIDETRWARQITVWQHDFLTWWPPVPEKYGSIVCNPPYFSAGRDYRDPARQLARHSASLSHQHLLTKGAALLAPQGRLSVVLPFDPGRQLIHAALEQGWYCATVCQVKETPDRQPHRLLISLSREPVAEATQQLEIRTPDGKYSPQFSLLTGEFYLNEAKKSQPA